MPRSVSYYKRKGLSTNERIRTKNFWETISFRDSCRLVSVGSSLFENHKEELVNLVVKASGGERGSFKLKSGMVEMKSEPPTKGKRERKLNVN